MPYKLRGILVHGLGVGLSTGLDTLAAKINAIPDTVHVTVVEEGAFAYELLGRNEGILEQIVRDGSHLLFGGHSMGADETWKMCVMLETILRQHSIRIPFAFAYDQTCWGTNGGLPGQWLIPSIVEHAASWRQPYYPGGGRIMAMPGNVISKVEQFERTEPHVGIEATADTHQWILERIHEVLNTLGGKS